MNKSSYPWRITFPPTDFSFDIKLYFSTHGRNAFPPLATVDCCLSANRAEMITCNLFNQSLSTSEQHLNIQPKRNPPLCETVFARSMS